MSVYITSVLSWTWNLGLESVVIKWLYQGQAHHGRGGGGGGGLWPSYFLRSKKKKGKQRKKRKSFKAETIKKLSPRSKLYCFSHSRVSRIQKFFLSVNHGGRHYISVFHGPSILKFTSPAEYTMSNNSSWRIILETEGSVPEIQKRALFHYRKVIKDTPNLTSPMFIASLQLFW